MTKTKTYAHPVFTEAYIIQLPQIVKDDPALSWTDRVAYWLFTHHKGDSAKVAAELGVKERRFRQIKNRLAALGHIERVEEAGQIKYVTVDTDHAYVFKIKKLREVSKVGFSKIGDQNIFALKLHHTYAHILHVMEVLEFTYRIGKTSIKKPHHLLTRSCKTGVTPHPDFTTGFWEQDIEEKARREKQAGLAMYNEAKAEERRLMQEKDFGEYLKRLAPAARKKLEDRAREEVGPFLSRIVSKKTQEITILGKMKEIVFNGTA